MTTGDICEGGLPGDHRPAGTRCTSRAEVEAKLAAGDLEVNRPWRARVDLHHVLRAR